MNARLHSVLKYVYAAFLLGSGIKHLYNIYVADPTIMATGYPEPEATAFVLAVLETKFLLPFICTAKLIAGIVILLPGREQLGVLTVEDMLLVLTDFGCVGNCPMDINGDGSTNVTDVLLVLSAFGTVCN